MHKKTDNLSYIKTRSFDANYATWKEKRKTMYSREWNTLVSNLSISLPINGQLISECGSFFLGQSQFSHFLCLDLILGLP